MEDKTHTSLVNYVEEVDIELTVCRLLVTAIIQKQSNLHV